MTVTTVNGVIQLRFNILLAFCVRSHATRLKQINQLTNELQVD